jgi:hypothetical protein
MTIVYVGIDLAKNVFAVHGIPALLRPTTARTHRLRLLARPIGLQRGDPAGTGRSIARQ